jgi:hypothetical protein
MRGRTVSGVDAWCKSVGPKSVGSVVPSAGQPGIVATLAQRTRTEVLAPANRARLFAAMSFSNCSAVGTAVTDTDDRGAAAKSSGLDHTRESCAASTSAPRFPDRRGAPLRADSKLRRRPATGTRRRAGTPRRTGSQRPDRPPYPAPFLGGECMQRHPTLQIKSTVSALRDEPAAPAALQDARELAAQTPSNDVGRFYRRARRACPVGRVARVHPDVPRVGRWRADSRARGVGAPARFTRATGAKFSAEFWFPGWTAPVAPLQYPAVSSTVELAPAPRRCEANGAVTRNTRVPTFSWLLHGILSRCYYLPGRNVGPFRDRPESKTRGEPTPAAHRRGE